PPHIGERALSLAQAALGERADASGALEATPAARQAAQAVLPEGPLYVGLGIGSREPRKNWPLEKFAQLSRSLSARGTAPVLRVGPREGERAEAIRAAVPAFASVDLTRALAGNGSFDFTVAIAQRLAVVVANDSGTGHLFGAAGRPIVGLFGPTDPRRWAPVAPLRQAPWARGVGRDPMDRVPGAGCFSAGGRPVASARASGTETA